MARRRGRASDPARRPTGLGSIPCPRALRTARRRKPCARSAILTFPTLRASNRRAVSGATVETVNSHSGKSGKNKGRARRPSSFHAQRGVCSGSSCTIPVTSKKNSDQRPSRVVSARIRSLLVRFLNAYNTKLCAILFNDKILSLARGGICAKQNFINSRIGNFTARRCRATSGYCETKTKC